MEAEFGVPARLMLDYQMLVGDQVDNVPGVHKVGPKTAVKLLQEYGSVDALVAQADQVKGAVGENLRKAWTGFPPAASCLTIKTDCDLNGWVPGMPALDAIRIGQPQTAPLMAFCDTYGFKGLARTLGGDALPPRPRPWSPCPVKAVTCSPTIPPARGRGRAAPAGGVRHHPELDRLRPLAAAPAKAELVALDTETTSLDECAPRSWASVSACSPARRAYIPLAHAGPDAPAQLPRDEVLARLKPWLEDGKRTSWASMSNTTAMCSPTTASRCRAMCTTPCCKATCSKCTSPQPGQPGRAPHRPHRHQLRRPVRQGAHQIPFAQVPVDKAAAYSCEDSDQTLDVHLALWPLLQADDKLRFIYELEIASSSEALYRIERNGVLIDAPTLAAAKPRAGPAHPAAGTEAYEIAGQPFNLSSPKQLGEIFFDKLGMPVVKKTATGARSTDEEVLEKLAEDYPCPPSCWSTAA